MAKAKKTHRRGETKQRRFVLDVLELQGGSIRVPKHPVAVSALNALIDACNEYGMETRSGEPMKYSNLRIMLGTMEELGMIKIERYGRVFKSISITDAWLPDDLHQQIEESSQVEPTDLPGSEPVTAEAVAASLLDQVLSMIESRDGFNQLVIKQDELLSALKKAEDELFELRGSTAEMKAIASSSNEKLGKARAQVRELENDKANLVEEVKVLASDKHRLIAENQQLTKNLEAASKQANGIVDLEVTRRMQRIMEGMEGRTK